MQTQQPINLSDLFTANKILFISSAAFLSVFALGSIRFFAAKMMKQRKVYSKLLDLELGPRETKSAKLITKTGTSNEIKQTIPKYLELKEPKKYTEADLVTACRSGDFQIVQKCIAQGVSVNAVDKGFSALYSAVLGNNNKIVQYLLECDADVNYTGTSDIDSVYILLNAVVNGNVGIVELLLEYGANVHLDKLLDKIGIPLNVEIVKLLVRYRANILTQYIETLKGFCNNKWVNEPMKSEAQKVYDYLVSNSHLLAT